MSWPAGIPALITLGVSGLGAVALGAAVTARRGDGLAIPSSVDALSRKVQAHAIASGSGELLPSLPALPLPLHSCP